MPRSKASGFTLVEILAVVAIIAVLMGIVMKLQSMVGDRTARARTVTRMQNLNACIEEYYRVYGAYPAQRDPDYTGTEYVSAEPGNVPDHWDAIVNQMHSSDPGWNQSPHTGLVYFIMAGATTFRDPQSRRWQEYWNAGVGLHAHPVAMMNQSGPEGFGLLDFTNTVYRLVDGWSGEFVYECPEPFQSYRLWSGGPRGKGYAGDNIGRDGWAE